VPRSVVTFNGMMVDTAYVKVACEMLKEPSELRVA
jgi:hypothetical protein